MAGITSQEKKQYLQRYVALDKALSQKLLEREQLKALAEKCTSVISGMPRGGTYDRTCTYDMLADIEAEINAKIIQYATERRKIERAIDGVDDITLQTLLRMRYLNGMTWCEVAQTLDYAWRHIYRVHEDALSKIIIP